MQSAIGVIESSLRVAARDLEFVEERLNLEFQQSFDQKGKGAINPMGLLKRLEALQENLAPLQTDVEKVTSAKSELYKAATTLSQNKAALSVLQAKAGVASPVDGPGDKAWTDFKSVMASWANGSGKPDPTAAANLAPQMVASSSSSSYGSSGTGVSAGGHSSAGHARGEPVVRGAGYGRIGTPTGTPKKSRASFNGGQGVRAPSGDYRPVSQGEFEGVSTLVRKRCKLNDVNSVYQTIVTHFQGAGAGSDPLTLQQLTAMGCKVVGQTGESKLHTLRALNIIRIDKAGIRLVTE